MAPARHGNVCEVFVCSSVRGPVGVGTQTLLLAGQAAWWLVPMALGTRAVIGRCGDVGKWSPDGGLSAVYGWCLRLYH